MKMHSAKKAFSLTETMIAVGILAVGMIFIAGVFPLGIHFNTLSTERSISAVVADEAFAKIQLHQLDFFNWSKFPNGSLRTDISTPFQYVAIPSLFLAMPLKPVFDDFFAYPSRKAANLGEQKQYYWSAICRVVDPNEKDVQVTVFVHRKIGLATLYAASDPDGDPNGADTIPSPLRIPVQIYANSQSAGRELVLADAQISFVNDGDMIMDFVTGELYRVLERRTGDDTSIANVIILDRPFRIPVPLDTIMDIWVVPPPVGGGRNPCIAVFQKEIRF